MNGRLRIVVLGMMGRCPFGGQTWLYLNWLLGLHQLGHEVWYVEDDNVWPFDPTTNSVTQDCSYAVRHISQCMERVGLGAQWAYRMTIRDDACWGLSPTRLHELYRTCDLLLNIVGATELREEHMLARRRVYVECDPVTAELRVAAGDEHARSLFASHDTYATYGENYGAPDCGVPLNGLTYHKTRQPVALEFWPFSFDTNAPFFTTIGNYRQEGSDVEFNGQTYRWSKHHEWARFMDLPQLCSQPFQLAMMPKEAADRDLLRSHGWQLVAPLEMSLDIFGAYPQFFRSSRGEFTVAKDQNVRLRSGWFSERDASYLASGKPVVTQDTGFSNMLPTGEGLFGVLTVEEAASAIELINSDYRRHCLAARAIAEEYFAARKVVGRLLADIGA